MAMTTSGHGRKTDEAKGEENERLAQVDAYVVERGAPLEAFPPPKGGSIAKFLRAFLPIQNQRWKCRVPKHSCKTPAQTRAQNNKNPWRKFAPRIPQESLAQICAKHFQKVRAQICARNPPGIFPPPKRGIYRKIFTGLFTHSKSTVEMPSA